MIRGFLFVVILIVLKAIEKMFVPLKFTKKLPLKFLKKLIAHTEVFEEVGCSHLSFQRS